MVNPFDFDRIGEACEKAMDHGKKYGTGKVVDATLAMRVPNDMQSLDERMAKDRLGPEATFSIFGTK